MTNKISENNVHIDEIYAIQTLGQKTTFSIFYQMCDLRWQLQYEGKIQGDSLSLLFSFHTFYFLELRRPCSSQKNRDWTINLLQRNPVERQGTTASVIQSPQDIRTLLYILVLSCRDLLRAGHAVGRVMNRCLR